MVNVINSILIPFIIDLKEKFLCITYNINRITRLFFIKFLTQQFTSCTYETNYNTQDLMKYKFTFILIQNLKQ